jgi:hypothetical protein
MSVIVEFSDNPIHKVIAPVRHFAPRGPKHTSFVYHPIWLEDPGRPFERTDWPWSSARFCAGTRNVALTMDPLVEFVGMG